MAHRVRNQLHAVDGEGRVHVILVESTRHVTRTVRGAIVQTGGDRFFLEADRQPLDLDPATARLRTRDGRREFTFKIG
ncbi:MAG: hypothetical protein EOP73_01135 [Variovorax sp.]|jgi:hypothetical protein|nr:MAG: hypothetical protein EOP73_01135 [Variovorax sp.]